MTKKDMAKAIAEEMGFTQTQAKEIVQKVFDGITATLLQDGRIELRNFGVFEVKKRQPRTARNPRTGEKVKVPEFNDKYSPAITAAISTLLACDATTHAQFTCPCRRFSAASGYDAARSPY